MDRVQIEVRKVKAFLASIDDKGLSRPYTDDEVDDMVLALEDEAVKLRLLARLHRYLHELIYAPLRS